jgi:peptidoglycan/LPS O-acetylase OafA/YrhL
MDWLILSSASTKYRPDIDGLRAIAVMLVVIFHAFPEAMPGGFIGVDIFFVISGFLITGIVVRELDRKRFSLLAFYNRRIKRIFPALIVVLCVTLVLGWLWMLPAAYAQLSSDVFASAAFFANIALLLQSGYFDIESARKPLLHLWSLGIEEQFYLFWPLMLMLVARLRLSMLAAVAVLGVASFVLNVALIGSTPVATFYLPFTRAWELLAGAALACGWSQVSQTGAASNVRASVGILLIATAAGVLDTKSAFPGWWGPLARRRRRAAVICARGVVLPRSAGKPAAGLDRVDQLPAVSLALAALGIFRHHEVCAADPAGVRTDRRTELCTCVAHISICRNPISIRPPEPAQDTQPVFGHGAGRPGRRCGRRGARLRFSAAAGNSRHGQCADAVCKMAVP